MKNYQNYSTVIGIIKETLHDFNLPLVQVYTEDTIPYKDRVYIKDNNVVRYDGSNFNVLSEYVYNKEVLNLTKNFTINSSLYDDHTHTYLGEYLRFLKDYKKLDLMGMYNCFNKQQPSKIYHSAILEKNATGEIEKSYVIDTSRKNYNFYVVPIKFNKKYTIAIDSSCDYDITCILYNNKFIDSTSDELIKESLKTIRGSKFTKPYIYSTYFNCAKDNWKNENILMMLLKLPNRINSSITILEGDYTEESNVIDGSLVSNVIYGDDYLPNRYVSKNSLLELNNHISYPFSDRLVEFLIRNTIDSREDIPLNIYRTQKQLFHDGIKGYFDIWDENNIRKTIHQNTLKEDITKGKNSRWGNIICNITNPSAVIEQKFRKRFVDSYNDITSYVDKDVETMIELSNSFKTKVLFDESELYIYAVYGWKLININAPYKEHYYFEGYYTEPEGKGVKCYDHDGNGLIVWNINKDKTTLYPHWIEEGSEI